RGGPPRAGRYGIWGGPMGLVGGDVGPSSVVLPVPRSYSARISQPVDGLITLFLVSILARSPPRWNRPASTTGFARHDFPFPKTENTRRASTELQRSSLHSKARLLRALMLNVATAFAPCRLK